MRTHQPARRRAAVAALGALAVLGLSACASAEPSGTPAAEPTILGEQELLLDAGAVSDDDALAACSSPRFAGGGPVEVLYAVRQKTGDGEVPVVLLRNQDGALRMCDAEGPDHPAQLPLPEAGPAAAVVDLTNGRMNWQCTGRTLDRFTSTRWLAVSEEVATVQQRFVVDGAEGPWFTTAPVGGYAHLQTWEVGPLPKGTEMSVEHRVLDADGAPVTQDALPTAARSLPWCESGDVQIG